LIGVRRGRAMKAQSDCNNQTGTHTSSFRQNTVTAELVRNRTSRATSGRG
jgi:hypothetical protein